MRGTELYGNIMTVFWLPCYSLILGLGGSGQVHRRPTSSKRLTH